MPIRILQLGPYPPPEGGITRNILAIRGRSRERGDRCSIISTSKSLRVVEEPDVYHPRSATELISYIRKIDHDILHLHVGGDITRRVLSLMVAAATLGTRPVLSFHSGGYPKTLEAQKARTSSARGRIFRQFSRIVVMNEELADLFGRYGIAENRIAVIAPFALEAPDPTTKLREDIAEFARSHSPLLVSVGGLEADYEPLLLISAMGRVLEKYRNAGLIIVGGGSMKGEVETAITRNDLARSILLAGNVPHDETLKLIAMADAMLRITLFDGDAISVREALFVGTPVIATDNGMRPAGVVLTPCGDADELVKNIGIVLTKKPARPTVLLADHSNIDKMLALYDGLL
jgi:glycosyltransferase involved in cell wall biosynthesis